MRARLNGSSQYTIPVSSAIRAHVHPDAPRMKHFTGLLLFDCNEAALSIPVGLYVCVYVFDSTRGLPGASISLTGISYWCLFELVVLSPG